MYCHGLRICIYILQTLFKYFLWYEIFNKKEVSKHVYVHGLVYGISHFHTKMPGKSLSQNPNFVLLTRKKVLQVLQELIISTFYIPFVTA